MKTFILTLDYELYGNGSGNIYAHIIEPTEQILALAELYKAKITLFVEVVEFWRIEEEWKAGNKMGYDSNPIDDVRQQLRMAYKKGHDIQLHIHPQWVDAVYGEDGWKVNFEDWRLGGYCKCGEKSLTCILRKGKHILEEWIRDVDPTYTCIALRAGGYNIQPSHEIVKAMQEVGLKIDSSIYPGGKETGTLSQYDYSCIKEDLAYWEVGDELEKSGNMNLTELPIVAFPMVRWKKFFSVERFKALMNNKTSAKNSFKAKTQQEGKSSLWQKIKYFFETEWQTWDFCLFSKHQHIDFFKKISLQKQRFVFVVVGHPKSFVGENGFKYFLSVVSRDYRVITIGDFFQKFILKCR